MRFILQNRLRDKPAISHEKIQETVPVFVPAYQGAVNVSPAILSEREVGAGSPA
jgi:hypothetical protein